MLEKEVDISAETFMLTEHSGNRSIPCKDDGSFLKGQTIGIGVLNVDCRLEGIIDCVVPLPAPASSEVHMIIVTVKDLQITKGYPNYPFPTK
jgi:hypothetical protein